jgi:hypothetical protein
MADFYDAFRRPPPQIAAATVHLLRPTTVGEPYALAALQREIERVATAVNGTRNHTLNAATFNLAQLIAGGALDENTVIEQLTVAAQTAGLDDDEIGATLASGLRAGKQQPRGIPERPPAPDMPGVTVLGEPSAPPAELTAEQRAQLFLESEIARQRLQRAARRHLDAEEATKAFRVPPSLPSLTEELQIPDEPVTYVVGDVMPTGANVLLTAQFKTGKTTLVNHLTRCLADGEPFLGKFPISNLDGRVALFNYEVDARQYRRWMREVGIVDTDRVSLLNLRGYRLPVVVSSIEDWIVDWLCEHQIKVWIVDPFARAYVGSGTSENDNTEVGRFLDTLDVIKERAGVSELVLPTHTGRAEFEQGQERARGATRLDDWADVRWMLTRDDDDVRYFSATGRDVEFAESALSFDDNTRSPKVIGSSRAKESVRRLEQAVLAVIDATPGISSRQLRIAVRQIVRKATNSDIDDAVTLAEASHQVRVEPGSRGAHLHFRAGPHVMRSDEED